MSALQVLEIAARLTLIETDAPKACLMAREWLRWREGGKRNGTLRDEVQRLHAETTAAGGIERDMVIAIRAILADGQPAKYPVLIYQAWHSLTTRPPF